MASLFHPDRFQGSLKHKNYFEGWYYKQATADERFTFAVIPGVSLGTGPGNSHCFIQFFDGSRNQFTYSSFDLDEFWYSKKSFEVRIGNNYFSRDSVSLDLKDTDIRGELQFTDLKPWPVTLLQPGAMGWYAYIPTMEDYHGIVSFDHQVEGFVEAGDRRIDLSGGRGYIEKDRGTSFPKSWIWMQSNHLKDIGNSLSLSLAVIPWKKRFFTGFITGLRVKDRLYRFCTYNGSKITKCRLTDQTAGEEGVEIRLENRRYILEVTGKKAPGTKLKAPLEGMMQGHVDESLNSCLTVRLLAKKNAGNEILYEDEGRLAGIEIHGDIQKSLQTP